MDNTYRILAIDHRQVFSDLLNKKINNVNNINIAEYKEKIMEIFKDDVNGILINPENYNIISDLSINKKYVSLEGDDYSNSTFSAEQYLSKNFSIKDIKKLGANYIKLFMYINSKEKNLLAKLSLISKVSKECVENEIPFLFEPIIDLDLQFVYEDLLKIIEKLKIINIDILKLQFPFDINLYTEEQAINMLSTITKMLDCPWILLSGGIDFNKFLKQLEYSKKSGCSGFAVGRALWNEYLTASVEDESKFEIEMKNKMALLNAVMGE